jgi:hypothetical protein
MALGDDMVGGDGQDNFASKVSHSVNDLIIEIEDLNAALAN